MKRIFILLFLGSFTLSSSSQITLSGTNYSQNFDGLGSGLPTGFRVVSNATATSLGTAATFTNSIDGNSPWNSTFSGWKNVASADGLISSSNTAAQAASTDRAVGIRQSGSVADPGAALEMQLANTTGFSNFSLSFKLQSLDITSPRVTTWRVDYGTGASPATFTAVTTSPVSVTTGGSTFTNTTVTVNFGSALDNISQDVWIRITSLTAATGTGNRATTGIDDISLDFSGGSGCTAPVTQASAVSFSGVAGSSFTVNWDAGSGTNSLVVIKPGTAVAGSPIAGNTYTANPVFGSGQTIAAAEYVVYNGTGNAVSVTGLTSGSTYHIAVFTFDNAGSCYNVISPATGSQTTSCGAPSVQVSTINVNASLVSATISWAGGNGSSSLVKINSVNSFTTPVDGTTYSGNNSYSGGEQVLYTGTGTTSFVTGLTSGTTYYVTVYSYNLCAGLPDYLDAGNTVRTFSTLINNNIPLNYYSTTSGLSCAALKTELRNIINNGLNHQSYNDLWTVYQTGDIQPSELASGDVIWDIYSDDPTGPDPYEFTPVTEQCGTYAGEGDCYNREHSFPQSWFGGGTAAGPGTDYLHIFPTDGYVNGHRSNFPYGTVGSASYTSANGSKLGTSNWPGLTGTVFEPINEYKGDVARAFLYMVTCYQNNMAAWEADDPSGDLAMDGTTWPSVEPAYLALMLNWHNSDPVSQKEVDRNNVALGFQGNRNPFVDHPEYVEQIWASLCSVLPVDILSFTGHYKDESVFLNWVSANAERFSHFEVERSINGGTAFSKAGTISYGQNRSDYSFTESATGLQGTIIYRLKLVDQDGRFRYSKLVKITIPSADGLAIFYPNPVSDQLTITFRQPSVTASSITISDLSGRVVSNNVIAAGQLKYNVRVDNLAAGTYLLQLRSAERTQYTKFIKQ